MAQIVDTDGALTYEGFPVLMSTLGRPCVFTTAGWMEVEMFERYGLTVENLERAAAVVDGARDRWTGGLSAARLIEKWVRGPQ